LNYKNIIQKKVRNNNIKNHINIDFPNIKRKYIVNPDKTHRKNNSMKSEDFRFSKGEKEITNFVESNNSINEVKRAHFNKTSKNFYNFKK